MIIKKSHCLPFLGSPRITLTAALNLSSIDESMVCGNTLCSVEWCICCKLIEYAPLKYTCVWRGTQQQCCVVQLSQVAGNNGQREAEYKKDGKICRPFLGLLFVKCEHDASTYRPRMNYAYKIFPLFSGAPFFALALRVCCGVC